METSFLTTAVMSAERAGHVFPEYAACECALESNWGKSRLAVEANNLFGRKWSGKGEYVEIPTREFMHGEWVTEMARWLKFSDVVDCFRDRMDLLKRLSQKYPHYKAALEAKDGETFVREVSKTWSTDPDRADKVLSIYRKHFGATA